MGEKYLKAFLVSRSQWYPQIHALDKLWELCLELDNAFGHLKEECIYLTAFYIPARYPGDYPEFSFKQAKEAFSWAKTIKEFVVKRIS